MARRNKAAAEQELDGLAEDWVTLWQSEIAGLMADPELAAAWGTMAAMGNLWLRALAGGLPDAAPGAMPGFPFASPWPAPQPPAGAVPPPPAGAVPPPPAGAVNEPAATPARSAPAAAAPDAGRQPRQPGPAEQPVPAAGGTDRMAERLAELERRLAEVELRPQGSRPHRRGTGRQRPPA